MKRDDHSQRLVTKLDRTILQMTSRKALAIYGTVAAAGLLFLLAGNFPNLMEYIAKRTLVEVGTFFVTLPFLILLFVVYFKLFLRNKLFSDFDKDSGDFLSVDRRAAIRRKKEDVDPEATLFRIKSAVRHRETFNYEKIREIVEQSINSKNPSPPLNVTSFSAYFTEIVETLEAKADAADEKASILLNKGTAYTKWGIVFFILSIIVWQVLAWIHEFQVQFIYGIVSCSLLFAFIEFLSAWFLRQYRHFVDTSTYLLRVKAILDRYLLIYLAAKEQSKADGSIDGKAFTALNSLLREPIRWPETDLFDKANSSFAKDAADSLASLTTELKKKKS